MKHTIKRISDLMFHAREKTGVSQEEMAEALDMSRTTVHRLETGDKVPNMAEFIHWYRVLGLNWFRDVLRLAHPELYDDFEGSAADVEQKKKRPIQVSGRVPASRNRKACIFDFWRARQ